MLMGLSLSCDSDAIKGKWRRVAWKRERVRERDRKVWRTAQKSDSTSQNYYSIHVQPDLNSLDFSIYSASVGPSGTKNTVACLTLAHSVIVCARRHLPSSQLFSFSFFSACLDDELDLPLQPLLIVVEAPELRKRTTAGSLIYSNRWCLHAECRWCMWVQIWQIQLLVAPFFPLVFPFREMSVGIKTQQVDGSISDKVLTFIVSFFSVECNGTQPLDKLWLRFWESEKTQDSASCRQTNVKLMWITHTVTLWSVLTTCQHMESPCSVALCAVISVWLCFTFFKSNRPTFHKNNLKLLPSCFLLSYPTERSWFYYVAA